MSATDNRGVLGLQAEYKRRGSWAVVALLLGFRNTGHVCDVVKRGVGFVPAPPGMSDGERLRVWRRALGYTQVGLARRAGVTLHVVRSMESDRPGLGLPGRLKVMRYLEGVRHGRTSDQGGGPVARSAARVERGDRGLP